MCSYKSKAFSLNDVKCQENNRHGELINMVRRSWAMSLNETPYSIGLNGKLRLKGTTYNLYSNYSTFFSIHSNDKYFIFKWQKKEVLLILFYLGYDPRTVQGSSSSTYFNVELFAHFRCMHRNAIHQCQKWTRFKFPHEHYFSILFILTISSFAEDFAFRLVMECFLSVREFRIGFVFFTIQIKLSTVFPNYFNRSVRFVN